MHDENVDRVTDGTGLIKDMTLAQLKELKVSTPAEPSGIYHIPTLAEVLELMSSYILSDFIFLSHKHLLSPHIFLFVFCWVTLYTHFPETAVKILSLLILCNRFV